MLSCVDLFAGAGGFSLAARQAGFAIKLAIENNRHAASTYRNNLCDVEEPPVLREGDISTMPPEAEREQVFKDGENCDLLLGGPPCQGFSAHRIKDAGVADERNDLIHIYFNSMPNVRPPDGTAFKNV
ncbi:DNA cytosine methyltransferase [Aminobacter ciceronei]|nr:DNA cytosine methyltransferase [Aminobacter ciceronei]